jgi:peptide/nickel transport system ATP-binding protein
MNDTCIEVADLSLTLPPGSDRRYALESLSFRVERKKIVCIVGESGSGKSLCAQAIMGLLPPVIGIESGEVVFDGEDLLTASRHRMRELRGREIAMIFQEPMTALNPSMRIGMQIEEVFEAHGLYSPRERHERALELIREVGLPDPEQIALTYVHQLSGGQRQRAMIAMALALGPSLLIADEPTTALDVTTQAQILKLIRNLQSARDMAVIFITHDFGVVAEIADTVLVLEKGKMVEYGPAGSVLQHPRHPYTRELLAAVPSSNVPDRTSAATAAPSCVVAGLKKTYASRGGLFSDKRVTVAVDDVSFTICRGETLGLVGESGSGKSTVARLMTRLVEPDDGLIRIGDTDFATLSSEKLRRERRRVQMIFQDPFASLNPRRSVGMSISDGPVAHGTPRRRAMEEARQLLELVGLTAAAAEPLPHEFSGGQRQRIGIARALALKPDLLIADEAVSALDVTIQAQVIRLLEDLKRSLDLSMLFITHDLNVAAQICDRMAVMHRGRIVELASAGELFKNPRAPYTQRLLSARPGASIRY